MDARALQELREALERASACAWEAGERGEDVGELRAELARAGRALRQVTDRVPQLPRVLTTGVDTLVWTAEARLPGKLIAELEERRGAASGGGEGGLLEVELKDGPEAGTVQPLEVLPFGTRAGYRWLARCDAATIGFSDSAMLRSASVRVEVPSVALWSFGAGESQRYAQAIVEELVGAPVFPRVSRIDYAVDFQGWEPSDALMLSMVSRAVHKRAYVEEFHFCLLCGREWFKGAWFCAFCREPADKARRSGPTSTRPEPVGTLDVEHFWDGLRYTGARWGSGQNILVRLYLKSLELERKSPEKIPCMRAAWSRSARPGEDVYDPLEPVWRLEAQLRRELLRELRTPELPEGVVSVEDALLHANSIVRYVIGPSDKAWLSLRSPTADPRRSRWPVAPEWRALQEVTFEASAPAAPGVREHRDRASTLGLAQQAQGCAARVAAAMRLDARLSEKLGREPTDVELFSAAMDACRHFLDGEDELTFSARVKKKARVDFSDVRRAVAAIPIRRPA